MQLPKGKLSFFHRTGPATLRERPGLQRALEVSNAQLAKDRCLSGIIGSSGLRTVAVRELPMLNTRVRFPQPAQTPPRRIHRPLRITVKVVYGWRTRTFTVRPQGTCKIHRAQRVS